MLYPPPGTSVTPVAGSNAVLVAPGGGYSMGVDAGYNAYHFNITSTGTSSRSAQSVNVQSFYVIGPSG